MTSGCNSDDATAVRGWWGKKECPELRKQGEDISFWCTKFISKCLFGWTFNRIRVKISMNTSGSFMDMQMVLWIQMQPVGWFKRRGESISEILKAMFPSRGKYFCNWFVLSKTVGVWMRRRLCIPYTAYLLLFLPAVDFASACCW